MFFDERAPIFFKNKELNFQHKIYFEPYLKNWRGGGQKLGGLDPPEIRGEGLQPTEHFYATEQSIIFKDKLERVFIIKPSYIWHLLAKFTKIIKYTCPQ